MNKEDKENSRAALPPINPNKVSYSRQRRRRSSRISKNLMMENVRDSFHLMMAANAAAKTSSAASSNSFNNSSQIVAGDMSPLAVSDCEVDEMDGKVADMPKVEEVIDVVQVTPRMTEEDENELSEILNTASAPQARMDRAAEAAKHVSSFTLAKPVISNLEENNYQNSQDEVDESVASSRMAIRVMSIGSNISAISLN